ncbi:hypothetical protein K239x_39110 [Planctomycetes bacterium K23_9]|uniref:Uncharacterized protein n=1 Tax=Stieleria marina TaxID=1930275 RepID=A0A517NXT4_9BACT|nr:hypothetical protein K239x_39110 [Planctomycetes bacterium K23_9]
MEGGERNGQNGVPLCNGELTFNVKFHSKGNPVKAYSMSPEHDEGVPVVSAGSDSATSKAAGQVIGSCWTQRSNS